PPGVEEVSIEVVLEHLGAAAVGGPQRAGRADVDEVNVDRLPAGTPFVKIFAVFVEDLNAMIGAIVHENAPGLRINGDAVNVVHVSRPRLVRRVAFLSPVEKELAVLVELRYARSVVAVGDK